MASLSLLQNKESKHLCQYGFACLLQEKCYCWFLFLELYVICECAFTLNQMYEPVTLMQVLPPWKCFKGAFCRAGTLVWGLVSQVSYFHCCRSELELKITHNSCRMNANCSRSHWRQKPGVYMPANMPHVSSFFAHCERGMLLSDNYIVYSL